MCTPRWKVFFLIEGQDFHFWTRWSNKGQTDPTLLETSKRQMASMKQLFSDSDNRWLRLCLLRIEPARQVPSSPNCLIGGNSRLRHRKRIPRLWSHCEAQSASSQGKRVQETMDCPSLHPTPPQKQQPQKLTGFPDSLLNYKMHMRKRNPGQVQEKSYQLSGPQSSLDSGSHSSTLPNPALTQGIQRRA